MGRHGIPARRDPSPAACGRDTHDRARIAQVAARFIADHGIADWNLAKRKAARELMLPEGRALPSDDEVEAALFDHHALFGGAAHVASLSAQRKEALQWMRRLAAYRPVLTGGVAAGWATAHSDIRLELVAEDAKLVELALLNAGVGYRTMQTDREGASDLFVDTRRGGVRLAIRAPEDARQRTHRAARGKEEVRLDLPALEALLAGPNP